MTTTKNRNEKQDQTAGGCRCADGKACTCGPKCACPACACRGGCGR